MAFDALSGWTKEQKSAVLAAYLGWMLDAFDFFLMVFVFRDIAAEFHAEIPAVAFAVVLTLALRPIGAFIFGRAADRYGRRPTLAAVGGLEILGALVMAAQVPSVSLTTRLPRLGPSRYVGDILANRPARSSL